MLTRQKVVLGLLSQIRKPLTRTQFVKLMFLLRHETELRDAASFYDFVPYRYGPFSFTLYRELDLLNRDGYVDTSNDRVVMPEAHLDVTAQLLNGMSSKVKASIADVVREYGDTDQHDLLKDVYRRYPWFALKSELPERRFADAEPPRPAEPAVYTTGYEGTSVDAFLNRFLKRGIVGIIDVRANPISRKYGFSRSRLSGICERMGLLYHHEPRLGIPSKLRAESNGISGHQELFRHYAASILPQRSEEVERVGTLMRRKPSALMCFEHDSQHCHRQSLATAVAERTGLQAIHL